MAAVVMGSATVTAPAAAMTTGPAAIAPSTRKVAAKQAPTKALPCKFCCGKVDYICGAQQHNVFFFPDVNVPVRHPKGTFPTSCCSNLAQA